MTDERAEPSNSSDPAMAARWDAWPVTRRRALAVAVVLIALLHNLWSTWLAWGDPFVDTGQVLEFPRRIAAGEMLYRDLRYYYGPLAPYLNAVVFKVFGPSLGAMYGAGIACAAVMCLCLYRLARLFVDRAPAALVCVAFLYCGGFGSYQYSANYNFAMPYSSSATYGMTVAVAGLYFLIRHACKQKAADFWWAMGCLVLTALTKVEILFAAGATHGLFVILACLRKSWRWNLHGVGYGAALALVAAVYGGFCVLAGADAVADSLFGPDPDAYGHFARAQMGLANLGGSVRALMLSAAMLAVACLAARMLSRYAGAGEGASKRTWMGSGAALVVTGVLYTLWWPAPGGIALPEITVPLRVFPFAALACWAWMLWRCVKQRDAADALLPALLLWTFAGAALGRVFLNAGAHHFGFYLVPVALVCVAHFWCGLCMEGCAVLQRRVWCGAGMGLLAGLCLGHAAVTADLNAHRNTVLETPRGVMRVIDAIQGRPVGRYAQSALVVLDHVPPDWTVQALPDGGALVFLAGRPLPYGLYHLAPSDLTGRYDEAAWLARWREDPPEIIMLSGINMSELGSAFFGVDYATECGAWIEAHYELWRAVGEDGYIRFLKRKGLPDPWDERAE